MKKILTTIAAVVLTACIFAQPPQKMSYQAVIRNAGSNLIKSLPVGMRISILQGSVSGAVVYTEIQTPTTNVNGLVTIEIGGGTGFNTIDWSLGPYFLKTETDPTGGTNYTITGISQLLTVPYAIYSKKAQTADYNNLTNLPNLSIYLTTESDPVFGASPSKGITNGNISNWNTAYSWGNHSGLYRPITYVPGWADVTGKPSFSIVATSGSYNDLTNKPALFNGAWTSLTGKPTTLSGYGITDAMNTSHSANTITSTNITNWNSAYGWGNHAGLYRPIGYIPSWNEITTKPTTIAGYGITDAVMTIGNQTVAGNKTFTGLTTVPIPINSTDAATKAYVDGIIKVLGIVSGEFAGIVFDIDGNIYKTVKIGNQIWMTENLKSTQYNDGTIIPLVTGNSTWSMLNTPGYCWLWDDESSYKAIYGALYNWMAVNTGKLCPIGWHVPTDTEWTTLTTFLGGESVAGGKMKETGTSHWEMNFGATNEVGFTGLPGGARNSNGSSLSVGTVGYFWSSTQSSTTTSWYRGLYNELKVVERQAFNKKYGLSVRCLKDN